MNDIPGDCVFQWMIYGWTSDGCPDAHDTRGYVFGSEVSKQLQFFVAPLFKILCRLNPCRVQRHSFELIDS